MYKELYWTTGEVLWILLVRPSFCPFEVAFLESVYFLWWIFLKMLQNSQESTCARDSGTGVFLWILQKNFKNTFFLEHLRTTASVAGTLKL